MQRLVKVISIHEKKIVVLIFLAALVVRLAVVLNLSERQRIPILVDSRQYDETALNILRGKGHVCFDEYFSIYFRSFRPPLYPLFLAFIYLIFGQQNYLAVMLAQSIMLALLCVFIYYIAKMVFDKKIALLSALILTFYKPYIFHNFYGGPTFLLSENLFIPILAILMLFLAKNILGQFGLRDSIISGIIFGMATLTRALIVLFPIFLFLLMFYKNKSPIFNIKKILPFLLGFILVILPWAIRNYFVHKAFVPIATEGGLTLFGSNNSLVFGGGRPDVDNLMSQKDRELFIQLSEVDRDKMLRRLALDFLFKNYKIIPKLFFKKTLVLWDVYTTNYIAGIAKRTYNSWYAIVLMFSLVGTFRLFRSKLMNAGAVLLILLFLYISILGMIFGGDERLRYPVEPYLIIFASVGIFTIYNAFRNKIFSYLLICIVIALNLLIYSYSDVVLNWARQLL